MDPLQQLNDISLGDPIGIWPLAWGWWLLVLLIIVAVSTAVWLIRRRLMFNAARRGAITELQAIESQHLSSHQRTAAINDVLKRCARHYFEHELVNTLHSGDWIKWLTLQLPEKYQDNFSNEFSDFTEALYASKNVENKQNNARENRHVEAALCWVANARFKKIVSPKLPANERGVHV